jgi:hypothetical protein
LPEILKVTTLIEHYIEHRNKNEKTNIFSFLSMHYVNGDVKDSDHDTDMQLPFKQYSPMFIVFTSPVNKIEAVNTKPVFFSKDRDMILYQSPGYSTLCLSNIWQPPRMC